MRLQEIINEFSSARFARDSDNDEILRLLGSVSMKASGLELSYDRTPNFFAFFKEQAEKAWTILFHEESGGLAGLVTITARRCLIQGRAELAIFLGDARFRPYSSKRIRLEYRRFFYPTT